MKAYLLEIARAYRDRARLVVAVFVRLRARLWFQRAQGVREVPDDGYFVAPDGSVRRKYPRYHLTKRTRRMLMEPGKVKKYVADSQAALAWSKAEIERKDAALKDIQSTIMAGKGSLPVLMAKLREAQT